MFYMVYVRGGGAPTVRHMERDKAVAEALRLSAALGRVAWVLESAEEFTPPESVAPVVTVKKRRTPVDR